MGRRLVPDFLSPAAMKSELQKLRDECNKAGHGLFARSILRLLNGTFVEIALTSSAGLREYEDTGTHRFVLALIGERLTPRIPLPNWNALRRFISKPYLYCAGTSGKKLCRSIRR